MPLSAIVMLIFGCLILYGGLAICLRIAYKHRKDRDFGRKIKKGTQIS
ncbi:hypothetical protein ES702_02074 [subsurface metagenome]